MAQPMHRWLDSLSEEWVSQPRSSTPSIANSSPKGTSSHASNASQSRIPRLKASSISAATGETVYPLKRKTSKRLDSKPNHILGERTSASINAAHNWQTRGPVSPRNISPGAEKTKRLSTGSLPLSQLGTVQHKADQTSPAKVHSGKGTADWKRRVLQGNCASGQQKDLFNSGPVGLETIFTAPTLRTKVPKKLRTNPYSPKKEEAHLKSPRTDGKPRMSGIVLNGTPTALRTAGGRRSISPRCDQSRGITENDNSGCASGSNVDRHEKMSPIYDLRNDTIDGRIEYKTLDASMQQLRTEMDRLGLKQRTRKASPSSDNDLSHRRTRHPKNMRSRTSTDDWTSHSLPDDLSQGTEAFALQGGFINVHRGGYSIDGSFQRRPLSPSSMPNFDSSQLTSPVLPSRYNARRRSVPSPSASSINVGVAVTGPRTPGKKPNSRASSTERPCSSGSPLKLFDKYDTFTNDRLIRRMSQFERSFDEVRSEDSCNSHAGSSADGDHDLKTLNYSKTRSPRSCLRENDRRSEGSQQGRICNFGQGELDNHSFARVGSSVHHSCELKNSQSEPSRDTFKFRNLPRSLSYDASIESDQLPANVPQYPPKNHDGFDDAYETVSIQARELNPIQYDLHRTTDANPAYSTNGKRLPHSPAKDPQPKRRRTLLSSDEIPGRKIPEVSPQSKDLLVQSIVGRKRKDARYEDSSRTADPRVLALRQILRPRNPTPNQAGLQRRNAEIYATQHSHLATIELPTIEKSLGSVMDPPTKALAGELASFALDIVQDITSGNRKASVTTADFFNEAQQIMQHLRQQGPPDDLRSATESEAGHSEGYSTTGERAIALENFPRPPQKAKHADHQQQGQSNPGNPNMGAESGDALLPCLEALHLTDTDACAIVCLREQEPDSETESDPPNMRVLAHVNQSQKRKHSDSEQDGSAYGADEARTLTSHPSTGPSTASSIPTASSRSSGRMVIGPDSVTHLLTNEVAGMTFDRDKGVWIKRKAPNADGLDNYERSASELTDENPLGGIPDLSIDELEEIDRIISSARSVKAMTLPNNGIVMEDRAWKPQIEEEAKKRLSEATKPQKSDEPAVEPPGDSSVPSKYSHFASSGPIIETRVTSWDGDALLTENNKVEMVMQPGSATDQQDEHAAEVEHEISILEGRVSRTPERPSKQRLQPRVVTVAFSSPLVDRIQSPCPQDDGDRSWEEGSELNLEDSVSDLQQQETPNKGREFSFKYKPRSSRRSSSRRASFGGKSFTTRPMSRVDEHDELAFLQHSVKNPITSMDVIISTPLPQQNSQDNLACTASNFRCSSISFQLTPLPDFTLHEARDPLDHDPQRIDKRRQFISPREVEHNLALGIKDLVCKITDIEPFDPYWESIRKLDLQGKELVTLHKLDDFCDRIQELDVSNNSLGHLNGMPSGVRRLRIRHNCLSDLTAWGHLHNLQYLDVSGNQLQSLHGFRSLVHLRNLVADNNLIERLDGIHELDGLIDLRLRNNRMSRLDLDGIDL